MKYVEFGRTGINISPLVLGTMMFGGRASKEDSFEMNCLLMNVLENLGHYNREEHQKVFSAIHDSKLHKEEEVNV